MRVDRAPSGGDQVVATVPPVDLPTEPRTTDLDQWRARQEAKRQNADRSRTLTAAAAAAHGAATVQPGAGERSPVPSPADVARRVPSRPDAAPSAPAPLSSPAPTEPVPAPAPPTAPAEPMLPAAEDHTPPAPAAPVEPEPAAPVYGDEWGRALAEAYLAGATLSQLAALFGVSRTTVAARLENDGVPRRPARATPQQAAEIGEAYLAGATTRQLAARFAISDKTVRTRLAEAGVQPRPRGRARSEVALPSLDALVAANPSIGRTVDPETVTAALTAETFPVPAATAADPVWPAIIPPTSPDADQLGAALLDAVAAATVYVAAIRRMHTARLRAAAEQLTALADGLEGVR